jgi:flagellar hook-associated protein 3 FlgL
MQVLSTRAMNTLLSSRMGGLAAQIQQLEQQVASGQKADTFAGLGTQATIDIALHNEAKTIATYQTSNQLLIARTKAMDQAMTAMHDAAESVKNQAYALTNTETQRTALIDAAKTAFNTVVNSLQVSVGGRALFAGTATDTSPLQASSTILASLGTSLAGTPITPPATTADAPTVEGVVQSFFATPSNLYQASSPMQPIQPAAIDKALTVDYGITGDNPAFQDILQGLATIAAVPQPNTTPPSNPPIADADYATVIQNAAAKLSSGVGQLNGLISSNGSNQALVDSTNAQHEATLTLVQSQINDIEQTDMTAAATRLALLRTQLEATYTITGQIGQLSLVNYLK